jgi:hypothetical protein
MKLCVVVRVDVHEAGHHGGPLYVEHTMSGARVFSGDSAQPNDTATNYADVGVIRWHAGTVNDPTAPHHQVEDSVTTHFHKLGRIDSPCGAEKTDAGGSAWWRPERDRRPSPSKVAGAGLLASHAGTRVIPTGSPRREWHHAAEPIEIGGTG